MPKDFNFEISKDGKTESELEIIVTYCDTSKKDCIDLKNQENRDEFNKNYGTFYLNRFIVFFLHLVSPYY